MSTGLHIGLILTALGFGFRHGIDWDHIAALTDLTSTDSRPRRSLFLATLYAVGHALVVFALGVAAIVFAANLPASVDGVMERFVGVTLVALGVWVFVSLARHGHDFRLHSRWMLIAAAVRSAGGRVRRDRPVVVIEHEHAAPHVHADGRVAVRTHKHRHVGTLPADPFPTAGPLTALLIGALHGVGAETPTQVVLFVTAAGVAGKAAGLLLLVAFLAGLLVSNSVVALAGTFGALHATRNFSLYAAVSLLTATFSLVIGVLFVLGGANLLPTLLGG
jgi:high-affinity nickel-transport protein